MAYCEQCGIKNLPQALFCRNCAAPLPVPEREKLQPGFGYNIHQADCPHGLKLAPMDSREKLALLGSKKYLFVGNLLLILCAGILLMFNIFRTDHSLWEEILEEEAGLFGPRGQFFTAVYFMLFCLSLLTSGSPLYTRNTYRPRQLFLPMLLELLVFPIIGITVMTNLYFGDFLGTTLSPQGLSLLAVSLAALTLQWSLLREYKRLRKSGIYSYVAN